MGKENAKDSDTVVIIAKCMRLVVYYIFLPLISFIFVPCSKVLFSIVLFFLKKTFLILRFFFFFVYLLRVH